MMSTGMAHNDLDRFGAGFFTASPRQADHVGPENTEPQLFGSAPGSPAFMPSRAGRHQYQSRFGLSFEARDSTNHGCSSEVWLTTRSITSFIPRSWSAASSSCNCSCEPYVGSISW